MKKLMGGGLTGRFYSFDSPIEPGTSLMELASELSWEPMNPWPASVRRFCQSTAPYSGELASDNAELAYNDDGSGIWRLWFREEERSVSKKAVEVRAAKMAIQEYGMQWSVVDPELKKDLEMTAKDALLSMASPKTRIVPVVMSTDWAWVGRRALDDYRHPLYKIVGANHFDPVVWEGQKWKQLSLAALYAYLGSEEGNLDEDVALVEIGLQGDTIRCNAANASTEVRQALSRILEAAPADVKRLSFCVDHNGEKVTLDVDASGLYRGFPARSSGGMVHERISRRFEDLRETAARVGEVMEACVNAV